MNKEKENDLSLEEARASEEAYEKLQIEQIEALVHKGERVAVDPHLAERMGAFEETAISLEDALEARWDETQEDETQEDEEEEE